jgi:hypothetical protein
MKRTKEQVEDKFNKFCYAMAEPNLTQQITTADSPLDLPQVPGFFLGDFDKTHYVVYHWDGSHKETLSPILTLDNLWRYLDAAITAVEHYKNH